jgi:hypothetical protein
LLVAAALSGCGGSSGTNTGSTATESTMPNSGQRETVAERVDYVKHAEAICARTVREIRALRRSLPVVISHSQSTEEGITNGLVRPGIKVLDRQSAHLRALEPRPTSGTLESYLGLFEPIIALARQRLQAGEAMDPKRGRALELLIAGLAGEQSALAKRFGFKICSVGFTEALGGTG